MAKLHIDRWTWGNEKLVWGYAPEHQYTFKILEPQRGREGCMSLQYHHRKSETWFVLRGQIWALAVFDGKVCTRIMRPGDYQNLPTGTIHRLMGLSHDVQVLEPSTPDEHAADKSLPKDVVRLHCVFGRPIVKPRNDAEKALVDDAVRATEEAISAVEKGVAPRELNSNLMTFVYGGAIE